MSQLTPDDFELELNCSLLLLYKSVDVDVLGEEVRDLKHAAPLRAIESHFRFGMHPHLEKYRQFFRAIEPEGLDLENTRLIERCCDAA